MLGHQILLSSGDSISRVLPIIKEEGRYRIEFESEFAFKPEQLVSVIEAAVKETGMAQSYIVEVEQCGTGDVVYSFKIDDLGLLDIVPCGGRLQPKSCYSLFFTILESKALTGADIDVQPESSIDPVQGSNKMYYIIFGAVLALIAGLLMLRRSRKMATANPNLIPLGEYQFDKRNTELIIKHQKIELTSKEADLLLLLYDAANTTVERERILNKVWGDEGDYVGRTLDVFISKLRKKLEFDSKVKIQNIRGVGYKLVVDS
ncbi:MAG: response regulator transcription factor [Flavobacteriaceae bacterium]|nr:winged helix-turn-helix domain-containing protein [Bacteroidia bacterium]NNK28280.1 response regulator transcription factor [Flavobacteriaceae bacterium]NNL61844.1 response regulator transcription factor [Flavobacteriaceae bacterium]